MDTSSKNVGTSYSLISPRFWIETEKLKGKEVIQSCITIVGTSFPPTSGVWGLEPKSLLLSSLCRVFCSVCHRSPECHSPPSPTLHVIQLLEVLLPPAGSLLLVYPATEFGFIPSRDKATSSPLPPFLLPSYPSFQHSLGWGGDSSLSLAWTGKDPG